VGSERGGLLGFGGELINVQKDHKPVNFYLFAFHQKLKENFERLKRVPNYDLHEIICFPVQKTEQRRSKQSM
jgi:hypothetical protein